MKFVNTSKLRLHVDLQLPGAVLFAVCSGVDLKLPLLNGKVRPGYMQFVSRTASGAQFAR
jgi:hypothetical protein